MTVTGISGSKGIQLNDPMSIVERALAAAAQASGRLLELAAGRDQAPAAAQAQAINNALALIALVVGEARRSRKAGRRRRARTLGPAALRRAMKRRRIPTAWCRGI